MKQHSGSDGAVQGKPKSHRSSADSVRLSAGSRVVKARTEIAAEIKQRLTPSWILSICKDWLPDGKRQGGWWVCRTPWRDDSNPSFAVSLTTGRWKDFAASEGGDIIELAMRLFNESFIQVTDDFADMLGITNA